jgi:hypothetical protein
VLNHLVFLEHNVRAWGKWKCRELVEAKEGGSVPCPLKQVVGGKVEEEGLSSEGWSLFTYSFFFFFLQSQGLNSGPTTFFWWWIFQDRVSRTICPGWLRTVILLISASWVARITDVSHWHPASRIPLTQGSANIFFKGAGSEYFWLSDSHSLSQPLNCVCV